MSESTGIPVIDELDALLADWQNAPEDKDGEYEQTVYDELLDAYPELRDTILRLQAERDAYAEALRAIGTIDDPSVAVDDVRRIAMRALGETEGKEDQQ